MATDEQGRSDRSARADARAQQASQHANLLALLRSGGKARQAAVKQMYEQYGRPFKQFFRRHRLSAEAAEDLVQDTFVRIVQAIESYRADGAFDAWLWTIARNTLMSHLRERKPDISLDDMDADEADGLVAQLRPSGSNPAAADCVKRTFEHYSKTQPECAEALMRVVVDGWGYEELTQYRNSTYGATREYLSQCRKRLMEFVQPCFEMSEGRSRARRAMADTSDEDFFEALAGRPPASMPEHERRRIEMLRAVIRARERGADASASSDAAGFDRLLFRLRREGLLDKRRSLMPYAVAALLVLGIGMLVLDPASWMRGTVEPPPVMRGDGGVQVIEAADAEARLAAITKVLQSQGVEPAIYPLGIHRGLNASVPPDKRAAVVAALKPLGIELPANGELRLEVRSKP